jgi:hypothetical protein
MTSLTEARMGKDKEPLTKRERLNRNLIIGCMIMGVIMGVAMAALTLRQAT